MAPIFKNQNRSRKTNADLSRGRGSLALSRKASAPYRLVQRSMIILAAARGLPGFAIAQQLNIRINTVSR